MNHDPITFTALYRAALRAYLKEGRNASLEPALCLGNQAVAEGLVPLDLATLHEQALITEELPDCPAIKRASLLKRAGSFFGMAVSSMETNASPSPKTTSAHLRKSIATLSQRCVELATTNLALDREITGRKEVEATLRDREVRYSRSLQKSDDLQEQLRQLSRQLLVAQEDERKRISRELHDVVAQALAGINIRLALLKRGATLNTKELIRNISLTHRVVKKSTAIVQHFARELRPTVLDDLGLIPALHAYLGSFTERTGVRSHLTAIAKVEDLDSTRRTVLFRITQEALANVARHARAT
ncbi:MAG: histidine kinase, partial [Verrucomicrobiales bacterium]